MNRFNWIGWLLAGLLLLQNAATGLAAPRQNPLEGRLLQQSNGTFYLYHDGLKFLLPLADIGDGVIQAIPTATADQWDTMFTSNLDPVPITPEPYHGYS